MTSDASGDAAIAPEDLVYRRVHSTGDTSMMIVDEATGVLRARGGAFKIHDDGCSVYLHSILTAEGLLPADVRNKVGQAVISVTAADVTDVGFGLARDPWPPDSDGHKRDAAHALIVNPNGLGSKTRQKALSKLAGRSQICVV